MRRLLHACFGRLLSVTTVAVSIAAATPAAGVTWYVGAFLGSVPLDDGDCGAGTGTHPAGHPCATLAQWTGNRRGALRAGDTVRLTGVFGPASSARHCIIPTAGVTYEGRTADDHPAGTYDGAIIDAAATTIQSPCHGGAINCRGDSACPSFANFTLRDLTLRNAPGVHGEGNQLTPGGTVMAGLTLDHVRFTGSRSSGLVIGSAANNEDNPCNGVRRVRDVTITDCQFDGNALADIQAGLWLTCTDGGTVTRTAAFDNRGAGLSREECLDDSELAGCETRNGFHFGGWINGTMTDSVAHDNGYYNYNFSGNGAALCDGLTHHLVLDRVISYDAPSAHFSFSHCNHDITIQNAITWGHGIAFNQYACAHHLRAYNDTFWSNKAMQLFGNCNGCDFRNNIFRCDSRRECIYIDHATRNPLTTWMSNVVVNVGTGAALAVFDSNGECVGTPGGACDCPGTDGPACPNSDPQSPGCPSPWKDDLSPTFANADLATFRADAMFGAETGEGDRWGVSPSVVDASVPSVAGLHLALDDAVARGAGAGLPDVLFGAPALDYDGDLRPVQGPWDAGADQIVGPVCGDGIRDLNEQCDEGAANGTGGCCLGSCQLLDTDGDDVCNAQDDCPDTANADQVDLDGDGLGDVCDAADATLAITRARVRAFTSIAGAHGSLLARGTFAGDVFSATSSLTAHLHDAGALDQTLFWAAADCIEAASGRVRCRTPDRRAKAVIKRSAGSLTQYAFRLTARGLAVAVPLVAPLTLDVAEGAIVVGVDRVGTIAACRVHGRGIVCRATGGG